MSVEAIMTAVPAQGVNRQDQRRHDKYDRLVATAQSLPKLKVAVAHPCDAASLGAVFEAVELGLIEPILVGPQAKIRPPRRAPKDLSTMRLVEAPHSHASAAKPLSLWCGPAKPRP